MVVILGSGDVWHGRRAERLAGRGLVDEVGRRAEEVTAGDWAGPGVQDAVAAAQAAVSG